MFSSSVIYPITCVESQPLITDCYSTCQHLSLAFAAATPLLCVRSRIGLIGACDSMRLSRSRNIQSNTGVLWRTDWCRRCRVRVTVSLESDDAHLGERLRANSRIPRPLRNIEALKRHSGGGCGVRSSPQSTSCRLAILQRARHAAGDGEEREHIGVLGGLPCRVHS